MLLPASCVDDLMWQRIATMLDLLDEEQAVPRVGPRTACSDRVISLSIRNELYLLETLDV